MTDHLDIVPILEEPVMALTIIMIINLVLLALRLSGPGLVADATFVFEMVLHAHVLLSRILRVEPAVATVAFKRRGLVTRGLAMLITGWTRAKDHTASVALEVPISRHLDRLSVLLRVTCLDTRFYVIVTNAEKDMGQLEVSQVGYFIT